MKRVFLHLKPKTDIPIYFSGFNPKDAFVTGKNSGRLFTEGRLEFFRDAILPKFGGSEG